MAEGLSIGTLTGSIELEDTFSPTLDKIIDHVKETTTEIAKDFGVVGEAAAIGIGLAITALSTATAMIIEFGKEGSTILGVENAFDQLAASAGLVGSELRESLSVGVKGTVDDFVLMKDTTRLLSSGIKTSAADFEDMAKVARELGKASGTDASDGLNMMSAAMTTGRVRALQHAGILVNLKQAEEDYAHSLGLATSEQLLPAEKKQADYNAILQASKEWLDRVGESEVSFKEKIQQAHTQVDEFLDSLKKGIASSPVLSEALDGIGKAFLVAFGGTSKNAIDGLLMAVDQVAILVIKAGSAAVDVAGIFHVAWSGIKSAVLVVETAVVGFLGEFLSVGSAITSFIAKSPTANKATRDFAASMKEAATYVNGMTDGLEEQTAEAARGIVGNSEFDKTLKGMRDSLDGTVVEMEKLAASHKNAAENAHTSTGAHKDESDAVRKLTEEQKKYNAALAEYNSVGGGDYLSILDKIGNEMYEGIAYDLARGKSTEVLAQVYRTTSAVIKSVKDAQDDAAKSEKIYEEVHKKSTETLLAGWKSQADARQKLADEINRDTIANMHDAEDYAEKIKQLSMGGTDLQIEQLETQRQKEQQVLESRFDTTSVFYQKQKQQIDEFYAYQEKALYINNDALLKNSTDYLQQIADRDYATYQAMAADPEHYSVATIQKFKEIAEASQNAANGVQKSWSQAFKGLLTDIPKILVDSFTGGGGISGALQGIGTAAGAMIGTKVGESLAGSLGSFAGPVGGAIGSMIGFGVGAAISGIKKLLDHVPEDLQNVARNYGVTLDDEMIKGIRDDMAKFHLSEQAATIFETPKLFPTVDATNFSQALKATTDAYSMLATHQLTVAQTTQVLTEMWPKLAAAGTDSLGILDKGLVQLIKDQEQYGTQSKAISDYVATQMTAAQTAISAALGVTAKAYHDNIDLTKQLGDVNKQMADLMVKAHGDISQLRGDDLTQYDALLQKQQDLQHQMEVNDQIVQITGVHSQESATAIANSIEGIIQANVQSGMSYQDAVKAALPAIQSLQQQLQATGYDGGAAFQILEDQAALVTDEVAGPALTAMNGYVDALVALSNAGMLNQDTFAGLTGQVSETEKALLAQGKSGKAVELAMQTDLQKIWELQQQYGYSVDDTTQALLDQAVADGIVGEKHKSTSQQMLDATNHLADTLDKIADKMGIAIPAAADKAAKDLGTALDKIHPPPVGIDIHWNIPPLPNSPNVTPPSPAASGGLVTPHGVVSYYGTGTNFVPFTPRGTDTVPAMLTPGESVRTVDQTVRDRSRDEETAALREEIRGLRKDITTILPGVQANATVVALAKAGFRG